MNPTFLSNPDEMMGRFPNLRYFLERGNKVVIADDGQSVEHVDGLEGGDTRCVYKTVTTPLVLASLYTGITGETLTQSACRITAPFFLCSLVKMSSGNSWMAVNKQTRRSPSAQTEASEQQGEH